MTPEQQQQWMAQWRWAAVELERVKRAELARLTDEQALRAADDLLALARTAYIDPHRRSYSGLIEQQRLFQKQRNRE